MPHQTLPDSQTYKIIGAAMAVHTELGCGFLERVYKAALRNEFEEQRIEFAKEAPIRFGTNRECFRSTTKSILYVSRKS